MAQTVEQVKKNNEPSASAVVPLSTVDTKIKQLEDYILTLEKRIELLEKKPSLGAVSSMRDSTPIIL
jgi:hypothetical protein